MRGSRWIELCFVLVILVFVAPPAPRSAQGQAPQSDLSQLTLRQREIARQRRRLASSDVDERRDAVMQLGLMGQAESSRVAAIALTDPVPIVRATAARAVLSLQSDEAAAILIPLLRDKKEFVRQEVAYALGGSRSTKAIEELVTALENDKQASVRGAAAIALGLIGDESASSHLARIIDPGFSGPKRYDQKGSRKQEKDRFVQRSAARSLGQMRSRASVPALIAAMTDKHFDNDVRREAAFALGLIGDIGAVPALREALAASDAYLGQTAFDALRKISPADAVIRRSEPKMKMK